MGKSLGRGLDAILPKYSNLAAGGGESVGKKDSRTTTLLIPLEKIRPNKYQARKNFDEARLAELAASIKLHGLAQPIVVSALAIPGEYELIAGERRLRAAKLAGLKEVPAIVLVADDKKRFHLSLAENIQREDLNPIEEALAYKNLMKEFGYTQEEVARLVGKDRSVVANSLRLLSLPEDIQALIEDGVISAAHGRTLAGLSGEPSKQKEILKRIIDGHLTVREVEEIVGEIKKSSSSLKNKKSRRLPPEIAHLESSLESALMTKVRISGGVKKGKIVIHYYSLEELERLSRLLKKSAKA